MSGPSLRPIFIGGCQRSGTTFLGALLGAAPGAVTVPESHFRQSWMREIRGGKSVQEAWRRLAGHDSYETWRMPHRPGRHDPPIAEDLPAVMDALVRWYAEDHGLSEPRIWVDHTPQNVRHGSMAAEAFPEARFIHLIRDGRAVAASVMPLTWGPNTAEAAARYWVERVGHGLALETSALADRVLRIRYEDLLIEPEPTLRKLCEFCELEFVPQMLQGGRFEVPTFSQAQHALVGKPPEAKRAQAWENALTDREVEIFESVAHASLEKLGYIARLGKAARPATFGERLRMSGQELWRRKVANARRRA